MKKTLFTLLLAVLLLPMASLLGQDLRARVAIREVTTAERVDTTYNSFMREAIHKMLVDKLMIVAVDSARMSNCTIDIRIDSISTKKCIAEDSVEHYTAKINYHLCFTDNRINRKYESTIVEEYIPSNKDDYRSSSMFFFPSYSKKYSPEEAVEGAITKSLRSTKLKGVIEKGETSEGKIQITKKKNGYRKCECIVNLGSVSMEKNCRYIQVYLFTEVASGYSRSMFVIEVDEIISEYSALCRLTKKNVEEIENMQEGSLIFLRPKPAMVIY